ncbi:MAG: DNA-protecting protein DprA [Chloroflexi bacterium]|nr:DNA-protecting protein DprA [Chloroflexota bacterium]
MPERKYWIGFNIVKGIGPAKVRALLDALGDLGSAWRASPDELRAAGIDRRALDTLLAARASLDLDAEEARVADAGITVLTWDDAEYPRRLREIPNSPPVLYVRGLLSEADEWALAVVGTRRASPYGREVARELVTALAASKITIVSGLARGIDAIAHQAALDAGGRTIAVLGSGLDMIYPSEHRRLAEAIAESGALVSDYALGTPPESGNFPPRNRIISGLSLGALVVEAGEVSGALITADVALEQGKPVFAVPGNILARSSRGTNRLIQQGAKPVLGAEDILEELNLTMVVEHAEARATLPVSETEIKLLNHLSVEPIHVDSLRALAGLPIAEVSSALAMMELKGMVRQVGGMNYILAREKGAVYLVE